MSISELIEFLEARVDDEHDCEINIYDSNGNLIEPRSFCYGSISTSHGFIDTVAFSDIY